MERERDVEKFLREQVEKRKGICLKLTSPGQDGMPDRIIVMPAGRVYFVELKTRSGELSKVQRYQLRRLTDLGQTCSVIYGRKGAEEFLRDLDSYVVSSWSYRGDGEDTDLAGELDGV